MPSTYHVWLKTHVSPQADMVSTFHNVLDQEKFSRNWLSQFVASEPVLPSGVTNLSDIPKMADHFCWNVYLCLKGAEPDQTPIIPLGFISAYKNFDSWAFVCQDSGPFSGLFQNYANTVIGKLIGNESSNIFLPPNSILIQDDLIRIHNVNEEPLQVPVLPKPHLLERIEDFLRGYNSAWLRAQGSFPSYYQYKIGLEWDATPSPETPDRPRVHEGKVSWPLFSGYHSNDYTTSAWLDWHTGGEPLITFRKDSSTYRWLEVLPFIGRLLLAMQEFSLVDLSSIPTPLVKPFLMDRELLFTCSLGRFEEALQRFVSERVRTRKWGIDSLWLSLIRPQEGPRLAWWSIMGTYKYDGTLGYNIGDIVAAALSDQELIVNLIPQPFTDRSIFTEFTTELLNYLNDQGFESYLLASAVIGQDQPSSPKDQESPEMPWMKIPNSRWYQKAVELWHQGYTSSEIAKKIGNVTAKSVTNELSRLRKTYGEHIVPTDRQRKTKLG